ncbi:MAG: DUF7033 domain-containing protein [Bacteroidota bacterium]
MKVFIKKDSSYYFPLKYVLKTIGKNQDISFYFVENKPDAEVVWDHTDEKSQFIHVEFYEKIKSGDLNFKKILNEDQLVTSGMKTDYAATIFYMINCLQEHSNDQDNFDDFGRFKYEKSYQFHFQSIEENLVQQSIDKLLQQLKIKPQRKKSTFFISHDIDSIYGSFIQDGFWAVKHKKIGVLFKLIFLELIRKPEWRNIDKIIKLNTEYDIKSTFFWLVNKGMGKDNVENGDYKIQRETDLLELVKKEGFTNGLHKSSADMTLNQELNQLQFNMNINRYHFLKFNVQQDWPKISDSSIELDCSLGFAERYGYRNSFGGAFQPFNILESKPYDFVETPLNFMDGTFQKYMKADCATISKIIIDFYEKNQYNCIFSLLWHNTFFTNYKYGDYIDQYKKVLSYIHESGIQVLTPTDIINQNKIEW